MLQFLKDFFAPRHRSEPFVVVTMRVPYGVSAEGGLAVRARLNDVEPDLWTFWNPGTFLVYFRASRAGASRATACLDALEPLRGVDPSLVDFECTRTEGSLIATFDGRGRVLDVLPGMTRASPPPPAAS